MAFAGYSQTLTAYIVNATEKIDEDTPTSEVMRIAGAVNSLIQGGVLSEEQVEVIDAAILAKTDVEIPEYVEPTTDEGLTLQDVGDALAELSVVTDGIAEQQGVTDDAVAELSEIVAALVPAE